MRGPDCELDTQPGRSGDSNHASALRDTKRVSAINELPGTATPSLGSAVFANLAVQAAKRGSVSRESAGKLAGLSAEHATLPTGTQAGLERQSLAQHQRATLALPIERRLMISITSIPTLPIKPSASNAGDASDAGNGNADDAGDVGYP